MLTTAREHAELKRDQIHAYGKDALIAACKGSMRRRSSRLGGIGTNLTAYTPYRLNRRNYLA